MRTLLTGALIAALALPWVAEDAQAHGGQYRGPGGALPPNLREPHDPTPPPPPAPPTGPTTEPPITTRPDPKRPPVTDPGGSPVPTPTSDPLSNGGRTRPANSTITADDWTFWYEANKDVLEELKRSIYTLGGSGNSPFGSNLAEVGARSGARQATRAIVQRDLVPVLLWTIDKKNFKHQDIESAAYIALAKVSADPEHVGLLKKGTASKNGITAESCCLALGLLRRERTADQFDAKTLDGVREFLFGIFENEKERARKRAFAAFGLGLLGDQPTGADGYAGAHATTQRLFDLLETKYDHPDLTPALLQSVGMQPAASVTPSQRGILRDAMSKRRIGKLDLQDYAASYAAQALGRIGNPSEDVSALQRVVASRRTGANVQRSAAIALGTLGARADAAKRVEVARELVEAIDRKRIREQTSRNLALISLAYLVRADIAADGTGVLGEKSVRSFLLRTAEEGRASHRTYAGLALGLISRALGDTVTVPLYGEFQSEAHGVLRRGLLAKNLAKRDRAAFAVALGIAGADRSIPELAAIVGNEKEDDQLRGYAAIGLGHIGIANTQATLPIRTALRSRRSEHLRRSSATALGLLRDRGAVPILLEELRMARSQSMKGQVVVALAKVGDERAIKPLIQLLQDPQESVLTRALSCAGLGIVGDINWVPSFSRISSDINFRATGDAFREVLSIL